MKADYLPLLQSQAEEGYRRFTKGLLPTVPKERILGVRMPVLRKLLRWQKSFFSSEAFLSTLPHSYHEEDLLHAFVLNEERDLDLLCQRLRSFLPHVSNWAVCDSLRPKLFASHPPQALCLLEEFLASPHPYTCRFAMEMLMLHYLDDAFDPRFFSMVAQQQREDYYVKMMQAWYFATALAKQYSQAFSFLQMHPLPPWVQNKAIQKARESLRLTQEQKDQVTQLKQRE